jgi:hypothetical protein
MVSWDEKRDRIAILQMNAEFKEAQLELLSAQCAMDRLRLRHPIEIVVRHAQPDVLQKAWTSANALYEYYNGLYKRAARRDR